MELNITSPAVEKSAEFKEEFFCIGNLAVVMTILRSKLYSNPIKTVVQEILSNARDAHREVDKADIPVEVALPNEINPNFEVKDFGPGISPERMSDVFLRYGESTKRSDNLQTGGFGLGAKSPFSYTDSFVIESITENKKRVYVAYIDESSIGKMSLISVEDTEEVNGTTIKIPVKQEDFSEFRQNFKQITEYWDIRPNVEETIFYSNTDSFLKKKDFFWFENSYSSNIKILIDKIPYNLPLSAIHSIDFTKYPGVSFDEFRSFFNLGFCMEVPCGELTVSANREQIEMNEKNLRVLFNYFEIANKNLFQKFQEDVNSQENYIEALKYLFKMENIYEHLSQNNKVDYRGYKISKNFQMNFEQTFFHTRLYEGMQFTPNKIKITTISGKSIFNKFENVIEFVVYDDYSCANKKLKKLVEQNPKTDFILLHPTQVMIENATDPKLACGIYLRDFLNIYGGSENYKIHYLSDLAYDRIPRAKKVAGANRPAKKELELVFYTNIDGVTLTKEDILNDPEFKLYYLCTRYGNVLSKSGHKYEKDLFTSCLSEVLITLLPKENKEKFAVFSCNQKTYAKYNHPGNDIEIFVKDLYYKKFSSFQIHEMLQHHYFSNTRPVTDFLKKDEFWIAFAKHTTVKNPFFLSLVKAYNQYHFFKDRFESIFLRNYWGFLGFKQGKSSTFYECFYKTLEKYPLLNYVDFPLLRTESESEAFIKVISDYINLYDSVKKEE